MDAFESIVCSLLEQEGYWVRSQFRVELDPEDKRDLMNPTMPDPIIDVLAYDPTENVLIIIEVKSYLDSSGVHLKDIDSKNDRGHYRILTNKDYFEKIASKLRVHKLCKDMISRGASINRGLAAGKVANTRENDGKESEKIVEFMKKQGWWYWSPQEISERVRNLVKLRYTNEVLVMGAKVLLGNPAVVGTDSQ